jgi:hypothetical protein
MVAKKPVCRLLAPYFADLDSGHTTLVEGYRQTLVCENYTFTGRIGWHIANALATACGGL